MSANLIREETFAYLSAGIAAAERLVRAAKRLDDYHACRLGVVVPDEVRVAIYAEHSAAVAAALPYFADGGIVQNEAPSAPTGKEEKAA